MSSQAETKMHKHGDAAIVYIPKQIVQDSSFPIDPEDWKNIEVLISGSCLMIRRRRDR